MPNIGVPGHFVGSGLQDSNLFAEQPGSLAVGLLEKTIVTNSSKVHKRRKQGNNDLILFENLFEKNVQYLK